MIEKSLYENYQISFSDNLKPDFEDYLFVFNENRELFLTPKKELPKTLDEFDMTRLENVSESTIRQLASCDFIKQRQNIVMIGNPGSGKTHLSIALGMNACEAGYRVKFYTAVNLAAELAEAVQMNRLSRLEKSLSKIDLLIIDELSYLTFNRYQSEMLFQIISERSERASVIISTNLEFSEWTQLFENGLCEKISVNSKTVIKTLLLERL